jgi:cell division protein FtsQ
MKPVWKYILISFFSLLILGYLGFSIWCFSGKNKEKVCGKLEIFLAENAGKQLITELEIAQILEQNGLNPIGKSIKNIRTESIEDILHKNPMIKVVECYKTPSGIVNIRILQRCPKFRVVGLGSYYIDSDRKLMPVSPNYAAYVPVISGRVTVSMVTGELFDFVSFLEGNPFWNAQIEQIYVREDKKIELIPRVGDAVIMLGTLDNYQKKLEKLRKLYVNGFKLMGWNKYKVIDLQYKDQVVCNKDELVEQGKIEATKEKKDSIIASKL